MSWRSPPGLQGQLDLGTPPRILRLFFGLQPVEGLREAIEQATRAAVAAGGGRPVPPDNYHVTLAFLGEVAEERLPAARAAAATVQSPPYDLLLDRIESWRNGILLLGASRVPRQFNVLTERLRRALRAAGFRRVEPPTVRLHMTLVRKVARPGPPIDIEPLRWQVDEFTLIHSQLGGGSSRYHVLDRWPLRSVSTV